MNNLQEITEAKKQIEDALVVINKAAKVLVDNNTDFHIRSVDGYSVNSIYQGSFPIELCKVIIKTEI